MDIKFSNFKGFKGEHQARVSPLTIVCGENSAGKSTLLQLLRFAYSKHPSASLGSKPDLGEGSVIPGGEKDTRLHVSTEEIGLRELAPGHKTSEGIRIEAEMSDNSYNFIGDFMVDSSVDGFAVEWKWKNFRTVWQEGDWFPSLIEFDSVNGKLIGKAKNIDPSPAGKSPLDSFPDLDPFTTQAFEQLPYISSLIDYSDHLCVYEFDRLELYEFFYFCLTKPNFTTFDILGKKAYGDEPLEELFPESVWCHEANLFNPISDYNSWDRMYEEFSQEMWEDPNYILPSGDYSSYRKGDIENPLSNPTAKEVLEIVEPILKNKKTRILLSPIGWYIFGDFTPWDGFVMELMLGAYISSYPPSSVASKIFNLVDSDFFWEGEFHEHAYELYGIDRFGFEIPSLRPLIPPSVLAWPQTTVSRFDSSDPASYINWIVNNEKLKTRYRGKIWKTRQAATARKEVTKTKALEEINEAFEKIGIPHSLIISKRDSEPSRRRKNEAEYFSYLPLSSEEISNLARKELRIRFKDSRNATVTTPGNVGSGVSQLLPIVAACELSKDNEPIVIEQPELHLHPKMQANVGEYLLDVAIRRGMSDYCPIIVETHSELFILRVLKMIKEGKADPSYVAVNYVSNTPDGPSITKIRIGPDGEFIDEWPAGFFEEQSNELF